MRYILIIVFITNTFLFSQNMNDKTKRIIGLSSGYSSIKTNKNSKEYKNQDIFFGFIIGAHNDKWRTIISSDFFFNEKQKYQTYLLQLNSYLLSLFDYENNLVYKPYLGASIGYTFTTFEDSTDQKGISYGGQAGIIFNIYDKVDFDFGYQFLLNRNKNIKNISKPYISINFLY